MRPPVWLCVLLAALTLVPPAHAAPEHDLTARVEFGFDGVMPAERWAPVRVILSKRGDPVSGTITVRYEQDGSQNVSTTTRFSLTPGVPTPVDVFVCFPRFTTNLAVTIRTDAGRTVLSENLDFARPGRSMDIGFRPPIIADAGTTLLSVGLSGLADVGRAWSGVYIDNDRVLDNDGSSTQRTIAQRMRISTREPDRMFASWTAYDGIGAMVVSASVLGTLPERVRREVLLWQSGGGQLIVILDDASDAWRGWLPEGVPDSLLTIGEPRDFTLFDAFDGLPAYATRSGLGEAELANPAQSINARSITLTDAALGRGWRPHYWLADGSSLAASAPIGLGFITLVGFDPARCTELRSRTSAAIAWAAVLDRLVTEPSDNASDFPMFSVSSGADQSEMGAINTLVSASVRGEGIGLSALLAVLAVLFVFVCAIGPFDAIVLRRLRLRHWSWLSALAWVALASVLAVQIPRLTVGAETRLGRIAVTDAVLDADANPVVSWSTALTTIYAGTTGPVGPGDTRPGAAWRGVSPLTRSQWEGTNAALALGTLRLLQRPEIAPDGARATLTPAALSQRVWTARAMLDVSPDAPPVVARFAPGDTRRIELRASRPGTEVIAASIVIEARRWTLHNPPLASPIELSEEASGIAAGENTRLLWIEDRGPMPWKALADLPAARARGRALEALTGGPSFALVEILYTCPSPPFEVYGSDTVSVRGLARLAVPIATPIAEHSQ